MALSIVNNTASLTAQFNLNQTNSSLNTSLERLSSGLKINSGADGPAAYVISQEQANQAAGLNAAISNTSQAVKMVHTASGALSQIGALLTQIRGLAVDSANAGANDPNALAANQAQVQNALSTIDSITENTQYDGVNLFGGASASGATTTEQAIAAYTAQTANGLSGLSKIDVSGVSDAEQALTTIDTVISQIGGAQSNLGAYQSNTLESNAQDLQATLQNTTAAESVVEDTDFAAETANFTQAQALVQAGTTVLANANATPQLTLSLLKS